MVRLLKKHCFWFFIMLGIFVHSLENLRKNTFKGSFHFLQGKFWYERNVCLQRATHRGRSSSLCSPQVSMSEAHLQGKKCVIGLFLIRCILETVDLKRQVQPFSKAGFQVSALLEAFCFVYMVWACDSKSAGIIVPRGLLLLAGTTGPWSGYLLPALQAGQW